MRIIFITLNSIKLERIKITKLCPSDTREKKMHYRMLFWTLFIVEEKEKFKKEETYADKT